MNVVTTVLAQLTHYCSIWAIVLIISCVRLAVALDSPLQTVVQGDLRTPHTFTVRAGAGDLISGKFERQGPTVTCTIGLYDERGSKVKEERYWDYYSGAMPVGFVAPRQGMFRIRISAASPSDASYTLRTEVRTPAQQVAALTVTPVVRDESARVAQLSREVRAGRSRAVERFWSESKMRGGPLVEPIDLNDREVLITFLWKEIYETHNVFLVWPGEVLYPHDHFLSRVEGTNVWYKTVRVARGSRFSYQLPPNDRGEEPHYTAQTDPLNSRLYTDADRVIGSVLELPGAPDESWYRRTPSVRGTVTRHVFISALLKGRRDVVVYTPPNYVPSKGPYLLLILLDGDVYTGNLAAANTLDNLIAAHRIRPTVVCFLNNTPDGTRSGDQLSPVYPDAIATELVPWLRMSYAVTTDPKGVVIGGESQGGTAAGFIALRYPNVFGNVLFQSGAGPRFLRTGIDAADAPVRFYFDSGLYEESIWLNLPPDLRALSASAIDTQRRVRDLLRNKGYAVIYHETGGAHQGLHWRSTLAEGLIALLGEPTR